MKDTQAENTTPKQDDRTPGRPSRRGAFDPRELWRLNELERIVEDAWNAAASMDGAADDALPSADLDLWLAPQEREYLELEARFVAVLEASPAFEELSGYAWRRTRKDESEEYASRFAHPGKDPVLASWLAERSGTAQRLARSTIEKDYQRTHDCERHWLRDLKTSDAYKTLLAKTLSSWQQATSDGGVPAGILQAYRNEMAQRTGARTDDLLRSVRDSRQARTKLLLHKSLVEQYPPNRDMFALLGGEQAYCDRLVGELARKAADDEFQLCAYGKHGFMRMSDTNLEVAVRVMGDNGAWRRSLARTLGAKAQQKNQEQDLSERAYRDLLKADRELNRLGSSTIGSDVHDYVTNQLLAYRMPSFEAALCRSFDTDTYIDALCTSANPKLRALGADLAAGREGERALQAALRRAYAEAAVSAKADPYLGYPSRRLHPRKIIIHVGPTNAGKTHDALTAFRDAKCALYLGPLRLLAAEVADTSNERGCPCSLVTGEERRLVEGAQHVASTVEMFDPQGTWDVAVIDEAQMLGDPNRGGAWSRALIGVDADELHICCAPEGLDIVRRVLDGCRERFGDTYRVQRHKRLNPLLPFPQLVRFPEDVQPGDACIAFSKRDVHAAAAELHNAGHTCCVVYGALPHAVRQAEARRFREGDAEVVVATDAIGMGLNLPVKRVVFLQHDKFNGRERVMLTPGEVKQIAGRAGRYGYTEAGEAASAIDPEFVADALAAKVRSVRNATLAFPRTLLDIDAPVSALFDAWSNAKAPVPFRCADYSEEAMLAERAEKITTDARTVYAFATLPFKSGNACALDLWEAILRAHVAKDPLPDFDKGWDKDDLESMQTVYDKLDLVGAYLLGPGDGHPTASLVSVDDVALLRDEVSDDISSFLARQSYEGRRCSSCGRPLPWGHRFGICERCFRRQSRRRF